MKAFSSPLRGPLLSRYGRVSSAEEIFFALRASESSERVELSTLFDHFRHEVEPVAHSRGDGLIKLPAGLGDGLSHRIRAKPLALLELGVERVGHRLDPGGIDRFQLVDQAEDPVQSLDGVSRLLRPDADAGKLRDAADLVVGKRHENTEGYAALNARPEGFPLSPRASLAYHIGGLNPGLIPSKVRHLTVNGKDQMPLCV